MVLRLEPDLVTAREPWISPAIRAWAAGDLPNRVHTSLADELARVDDAVFAAEYRSGVGIPVDVPELHWANRVLVLPDGGWALTGIRFRGRDVAKPFVDVIATTANPAPASIRAVAAHVAAEYAAFQPLCVRFDVPDPDALLDPHSSEPVTRVDQYVVAGLVSNLRNRAPVETFGSVQLEPMSVDRASAAVQDIYAELRRTSPERTDWAHAEDEESLTDCAEEGLLFSISVEDTFAGVVAAARESGHALVGFVVREICLDHTHRGRGVGPAVLQHLIQALPAEVGDTLWGTIHPDNTPSIRNALKIGRQKVGGYLWVTPPGHRGMTTAA